MADATVALQTDVKVDAIYVPDVVSDRDVTRRRATRVVLDAPISLRRVLADSPGEEVHAHTVNVAPGASCWTRRPWALCSARRSNSGCPSPAVQTSS